MSSRSARSSASTDVPRAFAITADAAGSAAANARSRTEGRGGGWVITTWRSAMSPFARSSDGSKGSSPDVSS